MRYAYPCIIVRDDEEERASGREAYTVTFPDVYGANTCGWSLGRGLGDGQGLPGSCPGHVRKGPRRHSYSQPLGGGPSAGLRSAHRSGETGPIFRDAGTGRYQRRPFGSSRSARERSPAASRSRAPVPHFVSREGPAGSRAFLGGRGQGSRPISRDLIRLDIDLTRVPRQNDAIPVRVCGRGPGG